MLLEKVSITDFRSISGTQSIHIDQFVTVLIGANDHGKTNLLDAIRALNDDFVLRAADRNWDSVNSEAPRIEWTFRLTDDETAQLVDEGIKIQTAQADAERRGALTEPERVEPAEEDDDGDQATAKSAASDEEDEDEDEDEDAEEDESNELPSVPVRTKDLSAIRNLGSFKFVRAGAGSAVTVHLPDILQPFGFVRSFLLKARPRVELFTGTTKILDSITLSELEGAQSEFMQGIFRKAEIWDERATLFEINPRSRKRLARASDTLTTRIRQEWQQGKDLVFHLGHGGTEGNKIDVSIEDPSVKKQYVQPTQRSSGFSAFFGMNMALFARKEASPANNYIFVFDEPATALHPHGQVNVQRVFETLSRKNQIVYTTHSIFMVNKNFPPRNRAITKTELGTLIDHKPYVGNWKAVRSNLGLIFANNFFVADTTLLVEGPSDEVYIASLLRSCDRLQLLDVDLNLFSIQASGTSTDMVAMARIMADEGRRVVALVDGDSAGQSTKKKLEQLNAVLHKDQVKIEVHVLPKGKSIEDCVLYPALLRDAVLKAVEELVTTGIRKLQSGLDSDSIRASLDSNLSAPKDLTLGRALQKLSETWFEDNEPISKLHVARIYDELVEALPEKTPKPPKGETGAARELAAELHKRLKLPEKTASEAIVE